MTMTKAIIKAEPSGIDIRIGWDDDGHATDEEKAVAKELGAVLDAYLILKENKEKKVCGTCALFYANGHCHKDPKNPVIMRSGEPACADYHSRSACNNGDCERHKLGAEPCVGCRFCDEKGNI